jgi:hypothetical protein
MWGPIVLKSGSLNVLEPSGPVQACNWIALPYIYIYLYIYEALERVLGPSCGLELSIPAVHKQNNFPYLHFLNLTLFLQKFMKPKRVSGKNREISPPVGTHIPETSGRNHQSPAARSKNTSTTGILHIPSQENINHAKDG